MTKITYELDGTITIGSVVPELLFSSTIIFIKLVYSSSVISLKWQWRFPINCHLSEITELKYASLIKMIILAECIYIYYTKTNTQTEKVKYVINHMPIRV